MAEAVLAQRTDDGQQISVIVVDSSHLSAITSADIELLAATGIDFDVTQVYELEQVATIASQTEVVPTPTVCSRDNLQQQPPRKAKEQLPEAAVRLLKKWLYENSEYPYPCEAVKIDLSLETNLSVVQINNWFVNARRRLIPDERRRRAASEHQHRLHGDNVLLCRGQKLRAVSCSSRPELAARCLFNSSVVLKEHDYAASPVSYRGRLKRKEEQDNGAEEEEDGEDDEDENVAPPQRPRATSRRSRRPKAAVPVRRVPETSADRPAPTMTPSDDEIKFADLYMLADVAVAVRDGLLVDGHLPEIDRRWM